MPLLRTSWIKSLATPALLAKLSNKPSTSSLYSSPRSFENRWRGSKCTSASIFDQSSSNLLWKPFWNHSKISECRTLGFSSHAFFNIAQLSIDLVFNLFRSLPTRLWPDSSVFKMLRGWATKNFWTYLKHGNTQPSSKAHANTATRCSSSLLTGRLCNGSSHWWGPNNGLTQYNTWSL